MTAIGCEPIAMSGSGMQYEVPDARTLLPERIEEPQLQVQLNDTRLSASVRLRFFCCPLEERRRRDLQRCENRTEKPRQISHPGRPLPQLEAFYSVARVGESACKWILWRTRRKRRNIKCDF
jgi:hypothetical protein